MSAMRDPDGNAQRFGEELALYVPLRDQLKELLPTLGDEAKEGRLFDQLCYDQMVLRLQYGAGDSLEALRTSVQALLPAMANDAAFIGRAAAFTPLRGTVRESYAFAAFALLLNEDAALAATFDTLVSPQPAYRTYLLDVLVKAFVPAHAVAKKYKPNKFTDPWTAPVLGALALPAADRPRALAAHMKHWTRLMRPFGWKPGLDTRPGGDRIFCDFAFEVALAVCGWDIDDSAFADHPYYPRDLVQYYRANVRHTRDAWRPEGAGAGVEIVAPPPPAKADLAKSKRKGIARWVELVADGDEDAVEAVLEAIGKPRKVKDVDELMAALGEAGVAIHADIKDDGTIAAQADALSAARGLGEFDGPAAPPAGPARCEALLETWNAWLADRGYRLATIDAQDDAWHAVVVRDSFHDELAALSGELGISLAGLR